MAAMMRSLKMTKVLESIRRRPTDDDEASDVDPATETPEVTAARCVKSFCQAGGSQGDEVTFLPPIVDAAESSPAAAAESARLIRKFLQRDYWTRPSYQYNAIMLIRILADNPGPTFTRNMDKKFVEAAKDLLRAGRDASVRQTLIETLDSLEATKGYDEGLGLLVDMWKKEKEKAYKAYGQGRPPLPPPPLPRALGPVGGGRPDNYWSRAHWTHNRQLPPPIELASRLEEACTSAKLLEQVVAGTAPQDMMSNDLIKEFADRCLSASRSIQSYMVANNPPPDNDTMESLIDANEFLQAALNVHQRAVLNARKQFGLNSRDATPALPSRKPFGVGKGKATETRPGAASSSRTIDRLGHARQDTDGAISDDNDKDDDDDDGKDEKAFRNPAPHISTLSSARTTCGGSSSTGRPGGGSYLAAATKTATSEIDSPPCLAYEPFHPGGFSSTTRNETSPESTTRQDVNWSHRYITNNNDDDGDDDGDVFAATPTKTKAKGL